MALMESSQNASVIVHPLSLKNNDENNNFTRNINVKRLLFGIPLSSEIDLELDKQFANDRKRLLDNFGIDINDFCGLDKPKLNKSFKSLKILTGRCAKKSKVLEKNQDRCRCLKLTGMLYLLIYFIIWF